MSSMGELLLPVYQGKRCLAGGSIWRRPDRPKNRRQLINLAPSALVQLVKGLRSQASQHFSICPLRLAVAPWVCHGSKTDLATEVLNVLHEGVACELRAVVGDDSVWHTKTADQSLEKLDS